ncbi:hypothetical protein DSO57_1033178 [Entomophthora muscae]|uniref:Uncharacterized protein n=1 Tax=Entomophthora muscae TaxID=34485 RepID=A0ACC2UKX7_9FUNG|nr:hypothetical protein DSO57_1033178 [Entomophthora muscae]
MSGLLVDWTTYTPGAEITDGFFLYQNMVIPLPAFNALSVQEFFQAPSAMPQATDKNTMPTYVVRAQSALDSQLASLEVIKHAAWKPPQSTFQGKTPPF